MVSTGRSHPSGRFRAAVDRINRFANDPNCGGSIEDISALVSGDAVNAVGAHDDPKDLVALLIKNNPEIWNDLLNNPFCMKMKTAKKGDQKMEEGFKRYMIQDFFYIANQMVFDTERVNKVKDAKQYNDAIDEVINHAEDAKGNLEFYNTDLKISSKDIFSVDKTKALMAYLKADKEVAENYRWNYIETLVFMIPCIKGWYDITKKLKDTSGIPTVQTHFGTTNSSSPTRIPNGPLR